MTTQRSLVLLIGLGLISGVLTFSVIAKAHDAGTYYPIKWEVGERTVPWRFISDFPDTQKQDRVQDGKQGWNNQDRVVQLDYQASQPDYAPFPASNCPTAFFQKDAVHWGSIDGAGGTLGLTFQCPKQGDPSHLYSFQIKFDSDEGGLWYSDSGTNIGSNERDFWSVATHEMGHATGWGANQHFSGSTLCPQTGDRDVMCAALVKGTTERRLDPHDEDTFADAYPHQ